MVLILVQSWCRHVVSHVTEIKMRQVIKVSKSESDVVRSESTRLELFFGGQIESVFLKV